MVGHIGPIFLCPAQNWRRYLLDGIYLFDFVGRRSEIFTVTWFSRTNLRAIRMKRMENPFMQIIYKKNEKCSTNLTTKMYLTEHIIIEHPLFTSCLWFFFELYNLQISNNFRTHISYFFHWSKVESKKLETLICPCVHCVVHLFSVFANAIRHVELVNWSTYVNEKVEAFERKHPFQVARRNTTIAWKWNTTHFNWFIDKMRTLHLIYIIEYHRRLATRFANLINARTMTSCVQWKDCFYFDSQSGYAPTSRLHATGHRYRFAHF